MRHVNNVALNGNAGQVLTSGAIQASQMSRLSAQGAVTGGTGIIGTLKVQVSNDKPSGVQPALFVPTNWSDLGGASVTINGNTNGFVGFNELCGEWVRVVWTPSSGSGGAIKATLVLLGWGSE